MYMYGVSGPTTVCVYVWRENEGRGSSRAHNSLCVCVEGERAREGGKVYFTAPILLYRPHITLPPCTQDK
jgi:hypothetical protein